MSDQTPYDALGEEPTLDDWAEWDENAYADAMEQAVEDHGVFDIGVDVLSGSIIHAKRNIIRYLDALLKAEIAGRADWLDRWAAKKLNDRKDEP